MFKVLLNLSSAYALLTVQKKKELKMDPEMKVAKGETEGICEKVGL